MMIACQLSMFLHVMTGLQHHVVMVTSITSPYHQLLLIFSGTSQEILVAFLSSDLAVTQILQNT